MEQVGPHCETAVDNSYSDERSTTKNFIAVVKLHLLLHLSFFFLFSYFCSSFSSCSLFSGLPSNRFVSPVAGERL